MHLLPRRLVRWRWLHRVPRVRHVRPATAHQRRAYGRRVHRRGAERQPGRLLGGAASDARERQLDACVEVPARRGLPRRRRLGMPGRLRRPAVRLMRRGLLPAEGDVRCVSRGQQRRQPGRPCTADADRDVHRLLCGRRLGARPLQVDESRPGHQLLLPRAHQPHHGALAAVDQAAHCQRQQAQEGGTRGVARTAHGGQRAQ